MISELLVAYDERQAITSDSFTRRAPHGAEGADRGKQ